MLGHQLAIQALEYSPRPSALGCAHGPEWVVMPQQPCQIVYIVLRQRRHTRYDPYDHGRTTFGQGWSAKVVQKSDKKMLTSYDRTRHVHA